MTFQVIPIMFMNLSLCACLSSLLLLLVVVFISDFQVFAFYHVFVKCNPYNLDSHCVGCLVLLLNLVLLTVPS